MRKAAGHAGNMCCRQLWWHLASNSLPRAELDGHRMTALCTWRHGIGSCAYYAMHVPWALIACICSMDSLLQRRDAGGSVSGLGRRLDPLLTCGHSHGV